MERQPKAVVALFESLRVADLSHVVDNATKPYPGDPAPRLETEADNTHDDCCVTRISMATHTGTHIDAAAHVMHGGKRLGDYPLTAFSGSARVADLRGLGEVDATALDGSSLAIGFCSVRGKARSGAATRISGRNRDLPKPSSRRPQRSRAKASDWTARGLIEKAWLCTGCGF